MINNKINNKNYEAWLLDFFEGNLSPEEINILVTFLNNNPQLNVRLDSEKLPVLIPEKLPKKFQKENLKKEISVGFIDETNFENYVIGLLEKDNTKHENEQLKKILINNPKFQPIVDVYAKSILHANKNRVFVGKSKLKKNVFRIVPLLRYAAAVAVLITCSWFFYHYTNNNTKPDNNLTSVAINPNRAFLKIQNPHNNRVIPKNPSNKRIAVSSHNLTNNILIDTNLTDSLIIPNQKNIAFNTTIVDTNNTHNPENNYNAPAIAQSVKSMAPVTFKEYALTKIKHKLLPENISNDDAFSWNELLAIAVKGIDKITKIAYNNDDSEYKKIYQFKIGKFEFSKNAVKKHK